MMIKKDVTVLEYRDTALALVFLCFLIWLFGVSTIILYVGMAILLITMIYPKIMKYPAMLWFGLSHTLGQVVSKIILSIAFFLLVVPLGVIRRLLGKDSLRLKSWKKDQTSFFVVRNHTYVKKDLFNQF